MILGIYKRRTSEDVRLIPQRSDLDSSYFSSAVGLLWEVCGGPETGNSVPMSFARAKVGRGADDASSACESRGVWTSSELGCRL